MPDPERFNVLIVGGGSAALEAAFRLHRVAAEEVETTILAPDDHFVTRAMAVLVPFAAGHVRTSPWPGWLRTPGRGFVAAGWRQSMAQRTT